MSGAAVAPPQRSSSSDGRNDFFMPPRYQVLKRVGRGSFGTLVSARDLQTGKTVAIKRVDQGGTMGWDRQEAKKLLREMRLLQHFTHENMMSLRDVLTPTNAVRSADGTWRTFYIVQDLMDTDLHFIISSASRGQQQLTEDHVRCFLYQILRGVKACHSAQVLHRDLKPANILIKKDCSLRIGDFGLARGVADDDVEASNLTEYVVTRWYRAPELLCGTVTYGPAVDLWSVGCILAEMLNKTPLFPGRDILATIKMILATVPVPTDEGALAHCITNSKAIDFIRAVTRNSPPPPPLSRRFPHAQSDVVDLLSRLLQFDPSMRISAAEALSHPYLAPLHALNSEPEAPPFDFSFESATDSQLRELLNDELRRFHPEVPPLGEPPPAGAGLKRRR